MATLYLGAVSTGDGLGGDWSNQLQWSSFTPVRGNIYYIPDGVYAGKTFTVANSTTQTITIKKATVADHGTSTGWSDTMGDGQAEIGAIGISTDYWIWDGQTRNSNWRTGAVSQYGIKITGGGAGGKALWLDQGGPDGCDNSTFKYLDIVGGGRDTGNGDDVVYGLYNSTNITFQYCSLRDSDRTIFKMLDNWANMVVDSCYIARNASSPAIHGEMCSTNAGDDLVWTNNVIEDCEGTAIWAFINDGTANRWIWDGNVIFHSLQYAADGREGIAGIVFVANDATNHNILNDSKYQNNTAWGIQGARSAIVIQAGTGNSHINNLWISCAPANSNGSESYNSYFATTTDDAGTGSGTLASVTNMFVSVVAPYDFRLTGTNRPPTGTAISSPYNVDGYGTTRGGSGYWDRGAYQLVTAATTIFKRLGRKLKLRGLDSI